MREPVFKLEREKGIESINHSIRLPLELSKHLHELADKHNMSFNMVVVQCIKFALNYLDEDSKEK